MTTIVTRSGKGSPLTHTEVDTNFTNLNTNKLETAAIPLGTAAAPSISFLSDADSGLFSPGANQVAVATNGTQRLLINSGGITSANGGVFSGDVTSYGVQGLALTFNSNNSEIRACRSGGNYSSLLFFTPGANSSGVQAERVRITSEGLVGIGSNASNANGGILQLSGGITFPATAVAASDANTLDDYEEGTWTPNQGSGLTVVGTFTSVGRYTKVGNLVYVTGYVQGSTSIAITAGSILCSNLIFTQELDGCGGNCTNYNLNQTAGLFATGGTTNLYASSGLTASSAIFFGFTFRV